jgi:hypothetical protein
MSAADTTARLRALEAHIAALETTNARLVDVASRLFDLVSDRTLWTAEEFAERDGAAAQTQAEIETAIRSRAPRGFKFPITVHETIVENRPSDFWVMHNYRTMKTLFRTSHLEDLLVHKGVITPSEQYSLAIEAGLDPEPTPCEENT